MGPGSGPTVELVDFAQRGCALVKGLGPAFENLQGLVPLGRHDQKSSPDVDHRPNHHSAPRPQGEDLVENLGGQLRYFGARGQHNIRLLPTRNARTRARIDLDAVHQGLLP